MAEPLNVSLGIRANPTPPQGFSVTDHRSPAQAEPEPEPEPPDDVAGTAIDTSVPHSARIWNYWLQGKDNYAVDRAAGDQYREIFPGITDVARTSRQFLTRAVRYLAGEAGIRQFLDVGTGLPTADNTHEVAQRVAPESRIVYVDNDPLVLAHARALLTSTPEGACEYLDADIRDPASILDAAAQLLDFRQPIALMLMGIMGHFTDEEAYPIVSSLLDGLPSGSYFALYDGANVNEAFNQAQQGYNESGAVPYYLRSPEQFARFFEGLELVEPGVVPVPHWRPDPDSAGQPVEIYSYCGVGRKR
jgi:S-adenosyl methyltransferase